MLSAELRCAGNVVFIELEGHIRIGHTATLRDVVNSSIADDLRSRHVSMVVLDLAKVSTVDAAGLGTLLEIRQVLQSRGIAFKLMNVNAMVRMVFNVTRLNTVFEVTTGIELLGAVYQRTRSPLFELASCA